MKLSFETDTSTYNDKYFSGDIYILLLQAL